MLKRTILSRRSIQSAFRFRQPRALDMNEVVRLNLECFVAALLGWYMFCACEWPSLTYTCSTHKSNYSSHYGVPGPCGRFLLTRIHGLFAVVCSIVDIIQAQASLSDRRRPCEVKTS